MYNVYILDSAEVPHGKDAGVEHEILQDCAAVHLLYLNDASEFDPHIAQADGIILWHHLQFGAELIGRLSRTRIIVRNGVGFDNVDVDAAAGRGIPVSNVPDYGTEEVADHALTLTLGLIRQLRPLLNDVLAGNWEWRTAIDCRRIRDMSFGAVGCGRIGTATLMRARAFGFQTCFFDPYLPSGYDKAIGSRRADSLEDLLDRADVVSLHAPLNSETRHLIGRPELERMKSTAFLVNTARGGLVDHPALVDALAANEIAGAGLDVIETEPHGARDIMRFPNCIVTPHSAFYSRESILEMRRKSAATVRDVLLHGRLRNVVNGVRTPIDKAAAISETIIL
jgi:phosphoglycerate dehydrogenase-like enzyme